MKTINKKAVEHNLTHAIKTAFFDKDIKGIHKAAQDIIDAGYELEDMKITPIVLSLIGNVLLESGFKPIFHKEFQ